MHEMTVEELAGLAKDLYHNLFRGMSDGLAKDLTTTIMGGYMRNVRIVDSHQGVRRD